VCGHVSPGHFRHFSPWEWLICRILCCEGWRRALSKFFGEDLSYQGTHLSLPLELMPMPPEPLQTPDILTS